jgi:hypothetical protein
MPIDKSATQLDALCAIIEPRGYILLPPNFAILSPQKTFSAACHAWRFRAEVERQGQRRVVTTRTAMRDRLLKNSAGPLPMVAALKKRERGIS